MHPLAFATHADDARAAQVRKMPADLRLVGFQNFHEEADTNLVRADQVEQSQPRAIGERAEEHFFIKALNLHSNGILTQDCIYALTDIQRALILRLHICIGEYTEREEIMTEVQALKAHLALNVHDVERSIGFYQKLFGIEPSKVRPGYAKFDVQHPPLNLT